MGDSSWDSSCDSYLMVGDNVLCLFLRNARTTTMIAAIPPMKDPTAMPTVALVLRPFSAFAVEAVDGAITRALLAEVTLVDMRVAWAKVDDVVAIEGVERRELLGEKIDSVRVEVDAEDAGDVEDVEGLEDVDGVDDVKDVEDLPGSTINAGEGILGGPKKGLLKSSPAVTNLKAYCAVKASSAASMLIVQMYDPGFVIATFSFIRY